MNEVWLYHFIPEKRKQSMESKHQGSPVTYQFCLQSIAGKIMRAVFWDAEGILMIDYLHRGQTITGAYCTSFINKKTLARRVGQDLKCCSTRTTGHKSAVVMAAINKAGLETVLYHLPYSPYLTTRDFFPFINLKDHLKKKKI